MSTILLWAKQLRIHQWSKNILVVLPILISQSWLSLFAWQQITLSLIAFCLVASSVYIANDLLDVQKDKRHPTKKFRPIASDRIPKSLAIIVALLLLGVSLAISQAVNLLFFISIVIYLVLNILYALWLKKLLIADVITLSLFYTIRIFAGCMALGVKPSIWLLSFSLFFFVSLATVKRYTEITKHGDIQQGKDYSTKDKPVLLSIGIGTGLVSVLVATLFIDAPTTQILYISPMFLWLIVIILLYWISRLWMLASRNLLHDDPVVFALKDKASILLLPLMMVCIALATFLDMSTIMSI